MADIFREIDEEVRRDKAAELWKKYGWLVTGLAVLAVAAVAGWQFWLYREQQASQVVGARLEAALKASRDGNGTEAETILGELAANAPAGYRQIARFRLAAETAKRDAAAGATAFDQIAADGSLGQLYRDLARLRAGMLRVDLVPYPELRTALEPLATPQGAWRHSAREFLGIAALKANLFEDAGRWFDAIVTDPQSPPSCASAPNSTSPWCAAGRSRRRTDDRGQVAKNETRRRHPGRPLVDPGSMPEPARAAFRHGSRIGAASRLVRDDGVTEYETRMTATVAIIGRPNVGKSTLFNRLVGKKLALVDDRPGVTRDRREGDAALGHLRFTIIDTAGLEEADPGSLAGRMRAQTEVAIAQADVILFMIDARLGLTPMDQPFADLVRKSASPSSCWPTRRRGRRAGRHFRGLFARPRRSRAVLGRTWRGHLRPARGAGALCRCRARGGRALRRELWRQALGRCPAAVAEGEEEGAYDDPSKPLRVTIIGRPNAGKSTLVNRMIGEDRLLVGPEAGITRDTISVDYEWRGRPVKLFDTAGMRKRARIEEKLEKMSVQDSLRAIRFAEVVVVLLDATIPFEKQDLTLVDLTEREGRCVVIGLNKWDLVADKNGLLAELKEKASHLLAQVRGVPIIPLSGLAGEGIDRLMQAVFSAYEVWNRRISTARINRWLEGVLSAHPPPAVAGRRIKIRYMTQAKARPPTFALFGNQLDHLPVSYTRYLVNNLREAFDLPGTPIRLHTRGGENPYDRNKRAG